MRCGRLCAVYENDQREGQRASDECHEIRMLQAIPFRIQIFMN